jgi:hypothetical protein
MPSPFAEKNTPLQENTLRALRSWAAALGLVALSQAALAAPVLFSGNLSTTDLTYNRTLSGNPPSSLSSVGTAVSYDLFSFHVTATGSYVMETLGAAFTSGPSDDTFIALYQNVFDAATPLTNVVQADDDSGAGALSTITRTLSSGVNYFLVVTSFANGQFGTYNGRFNTAGGDGQVVLGTSPTGVPEPTMLLLVPSALAALALARRRRRAA